MSDRSQPPLDQAIPTKILILALGNRMRGDDAIGLWISDQLTPMLETPEFKECSVLEGLEDGMAIVNGWEHTALTIVVDAAVTGAPPGTIHFVKADQDLLPKGLARCSSHGSGLAEAVALGRALDKLPGTLLVYAIEAESFAQGSALSASVQTAGARLLETLMETVAAHRQEVLRDA